MNANAKSFEPISSRKPKASDDCSGKNKVKFEINEVEGSKTKTLANSSNLVSKISNLVKVKSSNACEENKVKSSKKNEVMCGQGNLWKLYS